MIDRVSPSSQDFDGESELADLLGELSDVQQELLNVLATKGACMASNDTARMAELQPREEQLCDRLQSCHRRRSELLARAGGNGLPNTSLGKLVESLPTPRRGDLQRRVHDASARMRLLQHQSLANWVLAQRTMLHLSQLLEIIATGGQLQPTYGRGGSLPSCGALVDGEA